MAENAVPQGARVHVELDPAAALAAYGRHRRRFADEVRSLDDSALAIPSRCSKWTVADVLRHGCDVDGWMKKLWAGESLPFTNFDPTVTPHEFVVAGRASSDRDVRDRYVVSAETMAADVGRSGPERWGSPSFSPLGAVPWWLSAVHIFYDSWLHERDALLPLGIGVAVEPDEALPLLAYSLALVGTFVRGPTDTVIAGVRIVTGEAPVVATPITECDQDIGTIVDALSGRGSLEAALVGIDAEIVHRLGGLARLFLAAA